MLTITGSAHKGAKQRVAQRRQLAEQKMPRKLNFIFAMIAAVLTLAVGLPLLFPNKQNPAPINAAAEKTAADAGTPNRCSSDAKSVPVDHQAPPPAGINQTVSTEASIKVGPVKITYSAN